MKKALVIGFGISGQAAAEFLLQKGYEVVCADKVKKTCHLPIEPVSDAQEFSDWDFDLAVLSPGIPSNHPLALQAKRRQTELIGELELGCRDLQQPCIGITGTNGKTTVTSLISHILNKNGQKAKALGNIGTPLTKYLLNADSRETLVLELSSFQIETMQSKCLDFAAILNITPDHLDRYPSFIDYGKVKCRIGDFLKPKGTLFLSDDVMQYFHPFVKNFPSQLIPETFSVGHDNIHPINLSAAFLICKNFGISMEAFTNALKTFKKPLHRLQFIKKIQGIAFYNDSKATNLDSVIQAVASLEKNIWLLAGGSDKGASFVPWISSFRNKVKGLFVFGQTAGKIQKELGKEYPVTITKDLAEALHKAFGNARPGEKILLSPGCASYDQFKNFEHRGEVFQREVERLL